MLRISRSVSAAVRGSICERDDLIPSQESARGREASIKVAQRKQQLRSSYAIVAQCRGLQVLCRCYAGPERAP